MNGYQVSPVGRTGEQSRALDEHGVGHGDFSIVGIDEGCRGDIVGNGSGRRGEVIVVAHSAIFR